MRLQAQVSPIEANFRSPLDIPLIVAGNFGEVRSNHFHTGMDFKTMGVEGKNIYAIEDGYISRIAFSHYGYGRALYITHPNGYTSVYAHLSKFKSPIAEYAKNYQYSVQEETYNVYLDSGELVVKKGQIVALGGNSGSSSAPHLHFEIRETDTENPMNPMLFGYKITDSKKPMINNLKIYPLDDQALINGVGVRKVIPVKKDKKGNYYINQEIRAHGNIGFALHSTDRLNARNICGLYTLDLTVNGSDLFSHKMDKLDFSTNRYVNHHVDYLRHKRNNQTFHKSFMKGNNLLDIYSYVDNGYLYAENDSVYTMKYVTKDFSGNTSSLVFKVKGDDNEIPIKTYVTISCVRELKYNESNYFDTTGFNFLMAENTLYDDMCFFYNKKIDSTYHSDIHDMMTRYAPVHQYYKVSIAPNQEIDSVLHSKLLIVAINEKGKIASRKGSFQNGMVTTRVREFGKFAIAIDTTKPVVKPLTETFKLSKTSSISFKIADNLSGIQSYSARIDGEWVLASYKRKKGKLIVSLSEVEGLTTGIHELEVEVVDERANVNFKKMKIVVN
ncbi:MAG: M23 family metallopeptidase [Flavobacteriales bacterium]